jgi:hypothetical protein
MTHKYVEGHGSSSGLFSWFGRNRRIAKDYENLGLTLAAFVTLALHPDRGQTTRAIVVF